MFTNVLVASHGTQGAQAAEDLALKIAIRFESVLNLVTVINENWQHMTGDDWLNTSACRNQFRRHVESEVNGEADEVIGRVRSRASESGIQFRHVKTVGIPVVEILNVADTISADLIVVGARQIKQDLGFKSRLPWEKFIESSRIPVIIAPVMEY
jgi:nucleotide-binding universal stress UspA family protein